MLEGGPKSRPVRRPAQKNRVGYPFIPFPRCAWDLRKEGVLKDIDVMVLMVLLDEKRQWRTSCWISVARIGTIAGRTSRQTIH